MTSAHSPGDTRIFYKECTSLAAAGYEVYLVQRGESGEQNGVHIIGVGQPSGGRISRMSVFTKKVYEAALAVDADIYHFHDPELLPFGLKLKKRGKKVIYDSHEIYAIQLQNKPYLPDWIMRIVAGIYTMYEQYAVKKIDATIVPCLRGDRPFFNGGAKRLTIVDNLPILDELYNIYNPLIQRNPRQICYVGGLSEGRGITICMKAAYGNDCRLALGGIFMPPSYEDDLRSMEEFSCIDYRGKLNRQEIASLLNQSSIGISLMSAGMQYNCTTNFNTKIYEYMAMGLPVILSCNQYNKKTLEEWNFGIPVLPNDVEAVTAAIRYLLDHPDEARKMGENGRRAVKERFNWSIEEKKLLDLYEDVLKE